MNQYICKKCNETLSEEYFAPSIIKSKKYICKSCYNKIQRNYKAIQRIHTMSTFDNIPRKIPQLPTCSICFSPLSDNKSGICNTCGLEFYTDYFSCPYDFPTAKLTIKYIKVTKKLNYRLHLPNIAKLPLIITDDMLFDTIPTIDQLHKYFIQKFTMPRVKIKILQINERTFELSIK